MSQSRSPLVASLLRLGVLGKDDWDLGLQDILRTCSELMDVERASYWSLCEEPPGLACDLGYVRATRSFERGTFLAESAAPAYFAELRTAQVVTVTDTRDEPAVLPLAGYLDTHRIRALLDVPVFARSRLVGLLCHENVEAPRVWTVREAELALTLSQTLAAMLEKRARQRAETAEQRAAFLSKAATELAHTLDLDRARELAVRRALPVLGDMAALLGFDGQKARRIAQAHIDPAQQPVLEALCASHGADIAGPGIGVQALRERQSLLLPIITPESLRQFGLAADHIELLQRLRVRSVMSVLIRARGEVTGSLTFATHTRAYDREDLRFAEEYALQIGTLLDNTRLYNEAQAAVRARDEFLCLAGHELRTPLAALDLAVERLRKWIDGAPRPPRGSLETIGRQLRRLSHLTDLIVLASVHGHGELPLRFQEVDLAAVVRDVALDFADLLARAGCELRLDVEGPTLVRGDPTGLEVVLSNLLSNAAKFGKGAPVELGVARRDGAATLSVRDHGIGIAPEQLDRVFDRYERGVSCSNFGGLGLGLHITARIVAAHGGRIGADSRPGEGATFTVALPAWE